MTVRRERLLRFSAVASVVRGLALVGLGAADAAGLPALNLAAVLLVPLAAVHPWAARRRRRVVRRPAGLVIGVAPAVPLFRPGRARMVPVFAVSPRGCGVGAGPGGGASPAPARALSCTVVDQMPPWFHKGRTPRHAAGSVGEVDL